MSYRPKYPENENAPRPARVALCSSEHAEADEQQFFRHLVDVTKDVIRKQQELGLPIVFQRGDQVIKRFADGTESILALVVPAEYTVPAGIPILEDN